jgi:hypothetical protein
MPSLTPHPKTILVPQMYIYFTPENLPRRTTHPSVHRDGGPAFSPTECGIRCLIRPQTYSACSGGVGGDLWAGEVWGATFFDFGLSEDGSGEGKGVRTGIFWGEGGLWDSGSAKS